MRHCKPCNQDKPNSAFGKHSGHKSGLATYCLPCAQKASRASYHKHKKSRHAETRALRTEVINHYGGSCVCCGETRVVFLALDHIYGGGSREQKETGRRGTQRFRWLKAKGFPQHGYRVLCHNCNFALSWGACPHDEEEPTRG